MKWFNDLSTRRKLILCFGVVTLIFLSVVAMNYISLSSIQERQDALLDADRRAFAVMRIDRYVNEQRALTLRYLMEPSGEDAREVRRAIDRIDANITNAFTKLKGLTDSDTSSGQAIRRLEELVAEAAEVREERVLPGANQGTANSAQRTALGQQWERYQEIRTLADEASVQEADDAQAQVASVSKAASNAIVYSLGAAVGLILVIGLAVVVLNRAIAAPLNQVSQIAENITRGNLQVSIPANERHDEVGVLVTSFSRMTQGLQELAHTAEQIATNNYAVEIRKRSEEDILAQSFASMVTNIQETTKEIQDAVNVLSSSASEILASTSQASSSTSENATAINQISTTMDEVRQTAEMSSEKAQQVSDVAHRSNDIAQQGSLAVEATAKSMEDIRTQMDSIAQSMFRLTEQNQAIGEITATVAELAEQSNLLAVNASIEAAKAGEYGKGFSVVAQEIRSLAEQSKDATKRVRGILNDIQEAITTTGMATEEGMKAVQNGETKSSESGASIEHLVNTIGECAQAATQIAASSQQQLSGMEQVKSAMDNIREASNQNVAATKQSEEAARNLNELGQRLKALVDRFQTPGTPAPLDEEFVEVSD